MKQQTGESNILQLSGIYIFFNYDGSRRLPNEEPCSKGCRRYEEETYPSFRSETVNYDLATPVTDNMECIKEYIKHQDQVSIRRREEAETRDKLLIRMLGDQKDIDERVRIGIAGKTETLKGLQK